MMPFQLTLTSLLERAGRLFPTTPVITQRPDGTISRRHLCQMAIAG
jgi:hypothetical protein